MGALKHTVQKYRGYTLTYILDGPAWQIEPALVGHQGQTVEEADTLYFAKVLVKRYGRSSMVGVQGGGVGVIR
ncbi:hypothetical protein CMI37_03275 [Candidatus Pacearchaeota archaeon]|nr:hypothetical protein [Candidatus Pacearchaeota archaeon]